MYDVDKIYIDINTRIARDLIIYTGYITALIISIDICRNIDIDITKEATKQYRYQKVLIPVSLTISISMQYCVLSIHTKRRLLLCSLLGLIGRLIVVLDDTFVGTTCCLIASRPKLED